MSPSLMQTPGMRPLVAMTFLGFSGYAVLLPAAPLWAVEGGADEAGSGLVNGVFMLVTVLSQIFVPTLLRRFGWGPVMATGMVLLGLPSLFHLLSDELWAVLALAAVRGTGFGVLTVTGSAAVAELVSAAHRGRAVGTYGLAVAGAQVGLLPAAPWLADQVGFWLVFTIGALPVLAAPAALVLGRTLHRQPPPEPGDAGRPPYRRMLRPWLLLVAITLAGGALITFTAQMSSSPVLTLVGLFVMSLTAALFRWRIGILADRSGPERFIWPLVVLSAVGMACIAWAVRDPVATSSVALLVGIGVIGICYGGLQNLTMLVTFATVSRRHYSHASAVWNIGFDAGTGAGSVLVGLVVVGTSFSTAMLVVAAMCLSTLPLALRRPDRPATT